MNKEGTVYWITGLSGSGKTTIGCRLYERIKEKRENVVFLDGDVLRGIFGDADYSMSGRLRYAKKVYKLCKELSDQGIDIVICVIAMQDEIRDWYKTTIKNYIQIFIDVPVEELIKRDSKGLYKKALQGNEDVVGINQDVEFPSAPDYVIKNYGENTPDMAIDFLLREFGIG